MRSPIVIVIVTYEEMIRISFSMGKECPLWRSRIYSWLTRLLAKLVNPLPEINVISRTRVYSSLCWKFNWNWTKWSILLLWKVIWRWLGLNKSKQTDEGQQSICLVKVKQGTVQHEIKNINPEPPNGSWTRVVKYLPTVTWYSTSSRLFNQLNIECL